MNKEFCSIQNPMQKKHIMRRVFTNPLVGCVLAIAAARQAVTEETDAAKRSQAERQLAYLEAKLARMQLEYREGRDSLRVLKARLEEARLKRLAASESEAKSEEHGLLWRVTHPRLARAEAKAESENISEEERSLRIQIAEREIGDAALRLLRASTDAERRQAQSEMDAARERNADANADRLLAKFLSPSEIARFSRPMRGEKEAEGLAREIYQALRDEYQKKFPHDEDGFKFMHQVGDDFEGTHQFEGLVALLKG